MHKNDLRERLLHGTPAFPIAIYNNRFDSEIGILAPLHYHREFELFLSTKGAITIQIEENSYLLHEGDGIFINSGLLHLITAEIGEEHAFTAVVFDFSLLCSVEETIYLKYISQMISQQLTVSPLLPKDICKKVQNISAIYQKEDFGYEMQIKQELLSILHQLILNAPHTSPVSPNPKSQLIKTVLAYIEENYAEPVTLQTLADSAHISREYLCRIFSDMSDVSPIVYLNRHRIKQSTHLLTHTDKSISEIATLCGFNGSSYYNKLFLRFIGCTPTEYRTNIR